MSNPSPIILSSCRCSHLPRCQPKRLGALGKARAFFDIIDFSEKMQVCTDQALPFADASLGLQARCLDSGQLEGRQEEYLKLCQLRGLVVNHVDEVNDLGETILLASAAEGRWSFVTCTKRTLSASPWRGQS